jgi:hypothetical protein
VIYNIAEEATGAFQSFCRPVNESEKVAGVRRKRQYIAVYAYCPEHLSVAAVATELTNTPKDDKFICIWFGDSASQARM